LVFKSCNFILGSYNSYFKHTTINPTKTDSIVLYVPKVAYYYKSEAVIEIAQELGGFHSLLAIFSVLPTSLCDGIYDFIAKNRYRWFGKKEVCMLPTADLTIKFL
jgi:predicted DCC family thiol-disulfide oxidoreductase YuxK